jgi:uncharacterized Zn finger protein
MELLCKSCGESFAAFLHEMAKHNETITCPHCGCVHQYEHAEVKQRDRG